MPLGPCWTWYEPDYAILISSANVIICTAQRSAKHYQDCYYFSFKTSVVTSLYNLLKLPSGYGLEAATVRGSSRHRCQRLRCRLITRTESCLEGGSCGGIVYLFLVQGAYCNLSRRIVVMVKIVMGCNLLYPPRLGIFGPLGTSRSTTLTRRLAAWSLCRLDVYRSAKKIPRLRVPRILFLC